MSIYRAAVKNPVTTALIFIACMVFGIFSLLRTSIAQFPEFDANVIMVMSSYPGTNAADIETNLTKILENSLNGVENLKELSSTSKENISMLTLAFENGTDIDEATNNVRDKLDMVNSQLPDGATVPVIFKFSADDMPIMMLSATASESLPGLDKILDDKLTVLAGSGIKSLTTGRRDGVDMLDGIKKLGYDFVLKVSDVDDTAKKVICIDESNKFPGSFS